METTQSIGIEYQYGKNFEYHEFVMLNLEGIDLKEIWVDGIDRWEGVTMILYTNIDQTLVNSLHGLFNCEIGGLDCHVITTEYRTHGHCIHM